MVSQQVNDRERPSPEPGQMIAGSSPTTRIRSPSGEPPDCPWELPGKLEILLIFRPHWTNEISISEGEALGSGGLKSYLGDSHGHRVDNHFLRGLEDLSLNTYVSWVHPLHNFMGLYCPLVQ